MTHQDDLIRQLEDALEHLKRGDAGALTTLRGLFASERLQIDVGDISDSTAVAIGRDINQVINQTNMSPEALAFLDKMLRQPAIRAAIEAQQAGGHIFLSYSRQDAEKAQRIRNALEAAGHTVWQDVTALKGGTEWMESIERGIDTCYALVSVVSKDANQSEWVKIEYLHAKRREKRIVPLKIDDCEIPTMMLATHVIFGQDNLESGIAELLDVLPDAPEGQSQVRQQQAAVDRRALEIRYLDKLLLEHSVWQEVYTPMAGVAQIRRPEQGNGRPKMVTTPTPMQPLFSKRIKEKFGEDTVIETEERPYTDILPAVDEMKQLVILGDPGSGKTTTLWRIAADYAERAKADSGAPLPVFVRFGEMGQYPSLKAAITAQLGELAQVYDDLMTEGRLALLLDGLNELPKDNRAENVKAAKALVEAAQEAGTVAVVTCRELDYTGPFDMGIGERVTVEPLDAVRIHRFIEGYIKEPEEAASQLFWALAGDEALDYWQHFEDEVGETFAVFWLETVLPGEKLWGYTWRDNDNTYWEKWLALRSQPRSMLQLATNPFMLYMTTQVYTEEGELPQNRGALFDLFTDFLLIDREGLNETDAQALQTRLANLGYAMQAEGEGTSFSLAQTMQHMKEETSLYHARSASLLTGDDEIRFTHQLLQEYFAAYHLRIEMQAGTPAETLFPPENWWEPQGWEETCILLAGLYSDDCTPVVEWLRDAQPELAQRCITESGANTPDDETLLELRPHWLPRLTNAEPPLARAAIGRALGSLSLVDGQALDDRPGVGLGDDGLPAIDWVPIPAGPFMFGANREKDEQARDREPDLLQLDLPAYQVAKVPVTYGQYEAFVAGDGYTNRTYWTDAGWDWKGETLTPLYWQDDRWHIANHPVVGATWYEAYAFSQWMSVQHNHPTLHAWLADGSALDAYRGIRLPTEAEWEKAARGGLTLGNGETNKNKDRVYPYGDNFDAAKGNTRETGIRQTSAVGMFPQGAGPEGVLDMSGNVYDWCLSAYSEDYTHPEQNDPNGSPRRVVRGGSWLDYSRWARVSDRYGSNFPVGRSFRLGFRVVLLPS